MAIESLRRAVEAQERYVAALRLQKERRTALMQQIRTAMCATEPISEGAAVVCELTSALAAVVESSHALCLMEPLEEPPAEAFAQKKRRRSRKGRARRRLGAGSDSTAAWAAALDAFTFEPTDRAAGQSGEPLWFAEMTAEEKETRTEEKEKAEEKEEAEEKKGTEEEEEEEEDQYSDDFEEFNEE